MRLIEQIGAYAGLAAIPGLAVLSALYFSQARDVKRLREWAGRAPERAAEQASGGRVAVQPQQAAAAAAQAAQPAAVSQPAAAAAKPATAAKSAVAAAAATGAKPATATTAAPADGTKPPEKEAKPAAITPAAVAAAAAGASKTAAGGGGGSATGTVTRPGPPAVGGARPSTPSASPTQPPRRTVPLPSSSQTSVLPASAARPPDPWYTRLTARLPAARYIALIVAGALVLGGGAAFGITQLTKDDEPASGRADKAATPSSKDEPAEKERESNSPPAVNPADVTITVVNGTTIPNLARDTAEELSQMGFQIGNKVTGTGSLAAAESVVQYKPGAENEARYVAAKLDISNRQPADPDAIAQAGPAQVIVVLGADQAPGG